MHPRRSFSLPSFSSPNTRCSCFRLPLIIRLPFLLPTLYLPHSCAPRNFSFVENIHETTRSEMKTMYICIFISKANVTGSQSQKWKVDKIKSLLVRAKGTESKYIIRGLQGKLRIGLAQSTVLASLAHAVVLTRPAGVMRPSARRLNEIRNMEGTDGACGWVRFGSVLRILAFIFYNHCRSH
jgi:hypothetical protein